MGQTTGGFSSSDVYRRVASKDWVFGSSVSWSPTPSATRYTIGDYYTLKVDSTCTVTITGIPLEIEYIVVAGGGAGGNRGAGYGVYGVGGGGAGGVLKGKSVLPSGNYTFNIGAGGSAPTRTSGQPSYIIPTTANTPAIIANGGGVGGGTTIPVNSLGPTVPASHGQVGGSGGGAAYTTPQGNTNAPTQGNPGGPGPAAPGAGTGGGGAGRPGFTFGPNPLLPGQPAITGGQGGDGILVEMTGIPVWVAGGGGGGGYAPPGNTDYIYGGYGGTGSGPVPGAGAYAGRNGYQTSYLYAAYPASANTGGGGGASSADQHPSYLNNPSNQNQNNAGNGGSGTIFIRWKRI